MHRLATAVLCALTFTTCGDGKGLPKSGAVVASGRGGLTVTADDLTARLDEQPAFVRAGYASLERKKELLESVVRFEVLAQEAERQGLDRDPEALHALRKVMVQKLVQARMQAAAPAVSEAELSRYYDSHQAEYVDPDTGAAKPFEQVRAQLENKVQREQRARAFEAWVKSLKDGAAVSIDERALAATSLGP